MEPSDDAAGSDSMRPSEFACGCAVVDWVANGFTAAELVAGAAGIRTGRSPMA